MAEFNPLYLEYLKKEVYTTYQLCATMPPSEDALIHIINDLTDPVTDYSQAEIEEALKLCRREVKRFLSLGEIMERLKLVRELSNHKKKIVDTSRLLVRHERNEGRDKEWERRFKELKSKIRITPKISPPPENPDHIRQSE